VLLFLKLTAYTVLSATVLNFNLTAICSNTNTVTDRIVTVTTAAMSLPFLEDSFLQCSHNLSNDKDSHNTLWSGHVSQKLN